jgi:hypothetical protein
MEEDLAKRIKGDHRDLKNLKIEFERLEKLLRSSLSSVNDHTKDELTKFRNEVKSTLTEHYEYI